MFIANDVAGGRVRRFCGTQLVATCLLSLVVSACVDELIGPPAEPHGKVSLSVALGSGSMQIPIAGAHITVSRLNGEITTDTLVAVPAGADSLVVDLNISLLLTAPADPPRETFVLELLLIGPDGEIVYAAGPDTVDVAATATPTAISAPLRYVGVGYDAASVEITNTDLLLAMGDSLQLAAVARDSAGETIVGTPIVWEVDTGRLLLEPSTVVAVGLPSRGAARIVARTLTGQADTLEVLIYAVPVRIEVLGGDDREGLAGEPLPDSIRVRVLGADSLPIPDVLVRFVLVDGGGSVSADSAVTDPLGIAAVAWTLGTEELQHLSVSAENVEHSVIARILMPASLVVVAGGDQVGVSGLSLADSLGVQVLTESGLPVPNVWVLFAAGSAESGTLSADSALSDSNGVARVAWTLGDGDSQQVTASAGVLPAVDAAAYAIREDGSPIQPGERHTCMLDAGQELYCWGSGSYLRLALGVSSTPLQMGYSQFTRIASGPIHQCFLDTAGEAYCAGNNGSGELGAGTTDYVEGPVHVAGGHVFRMLTVGRGHSCGVTTAFQALCWGSNVYGRLGDGSSNLSSVPVAVLGDLRFAALSAGDLFTCGLTIDGRAFCWGNNGFGQLGDGSTIDATEPREVVGNLRFVAIAGGGAHTCAVTGEGASYCWGFGGYGQLGSSGGTTATPRVVDSPVAFRTVEAGAQFSCAQTATQDVWCWGRNDAGQVGDGSTMSSAAPRFVAAGISSYSLGPTHACGIQGGTAWCWGSDQYGKLGSGRALDALSPQEVFGGQGFNGVSTGEHHACGFRSSDGMGFCWGNNDSGQLGTGTFTPASEATQILVSQPITSVAAGVTHSCATIDNAELQCWGAGVPTPSASSDGLTIRESSAGSRYTCATAYAGGRSWCWGDNNQFGQLGNGTTTGTTIPQETTPAFMHVSASTFHSCGVTADYAAYCWGNNSSGQLGNNSTTSSLSPVPVAGGLQFLEVSAGDTHTCGVTTAYAAYCWGSGMKLGAGAVTSSLVPVAVEGGHTFFTIAAGWGHTCAIRENDLAAMCWGYNAQGELGDGTRSSSSVPVPVSDGLQFFRIDVNQEYTCAVSVGLSAYCWGTNVSGQLGTGYPLIATSPQPVVSSPIAAPANSIRGRP